MGNEHAPPRPVATQGKHPASRAIEQVMHACSRSRPPVWVPPVSGHRGRVKMLADASRCASYRQPQRGACSSEHPRRRVKPRYRAIKRQGAAQIPCPSPINALQREFLFAFCSETTDSSTANHRATAARTPQTLAHRSPASDLSAIRQWICKAGIHHFGKQPAFYGQFKSTTQ